MSIPKGTQLPMAKWKGRFLPDSFQCPWCNKKMLCLKQTFTGYKHAPKIIELRCMWKASVYKCCDGHVLLISDS